jgi:hypothetical protein
MRIKFARCIKWQPKWIWSSLDLIATIGWQTMWIQSPPLDLVVAIGWKLEWGGCDKPPFACFSHSQGWAI